MTGPTDAQDEALVDVVRQRQLHEDPVDGVVGVQLGDEREQVVLAGLGRQMMVVRLDPGLAGRLVLLADVDLGGRVVADEDGRQTESSESRHLRGHLRADRARPGQLRPSSSQSRD